MHTFKRFTLFFVPLAVSPMLAWSSPGDGLYGTAHDFASGTGPQSSSKPIGLCTFCHTPHKSGESLLLWNHTLSTNTFSWSSEKTSAGTEYPLFKGDVYKGPTAKCLSCHDGSVALGDIGWFGGGLHVGGSDTSTYKMDPGSPLQVGAGGNLAGNHPVAMPYPYNNVPSTYNGKTTGPAAQLSDWEGDPTLLASARIRLYKDDGAGNITPGAATGRTGVECSSCHDPHNKAAVEASFLRGKLSGLVQSDGYLCVQCHKK